MAERLWAELSDLVRQGWALLRGARWSMLGLGLALVGVAVVLVPNDADVLRELVGRRTPELRRAAKAFTYWGDYHTGSLILAASVLAAALLRKSARLRRAALASILAASLAGLTANVFRGLLGRPRPIARLPDGLYGPTLDFDLQGSPSAHAATSVGSTSALLVTLPQVGVPAVLAAVGVVWSRLYLRHHHPTDVLLGGALGATFGVALGLAARRRSRETPPAPGAPVEDEARR